MEITLPMKNFTEELGITGHLTIIKRFNDGQEEVVFDDHNIIVSGMGVGLTYMFTGSGSNIVLDYQIDRFQLGVSGKPDQVPSLELSSTYQLSGALTGIGEYGAGSNLFIEEASQIKNGVTVTGQFFPLIPANKITRIGDSSVRYTLVVDEEACNSLERAGESLNLNEVGLFMKNPTGATTNASILAAYRTFSNIFKTNDFSLIFRWTLNF
jgi:hypothetical protein